MRASLPLRPIVLSLLALALPAAAQTIVLPHSGYLRTGADAPVTGTLAMTFRISDAPTASGETVLWTGSCNVTVAAGYYSVALGPGSCGGPLPATVTTTAAARYLEVEVASVVLAPRQLLGPVTRATYADVAGTLAAGPLAALVSKAELGTLPLPMQGTPGGTTFLRGDGQWAVPPVNTGATGPQGPAGDPGAPGAAGATGANGATWRTGAGAPANALGVDGDLYLDTTAPNTFSQRVGGVYVARGTLQGAAGADGSSGAAPAQLSSGAAATIPSVGDGGHARILLTANTTLTLPPAPVAANTGMQFTVELTQDATGGRTVAWAPQSGGSIVWDGSATAPAPQSLANTSTIYAFLGYAGVAAWRGSVTFREVTVQAGTQVFSCTGANQTFTVPAGVTQLTVKEWGAGGAGGSYEGTAKAGLTGGAGGYASGVLAVTPGEQLTVIVGCGGIAASDQGGGGGGRTAIRRGSTELITAGGGGGGSYDGAGGPGGGATGLAGTGNTYAVGGGSVGGQGGTNTTGGLLSSNTCTAYGTAALSGTQYAGGIGSGLDYGGYGGFGGGANGNLGYGGGGGGGGWYGGGGGHCWSGGGGGSGLVPSGGTNTAGAGTVPGNGGDTDRQGAGNGGGSKQNGGNGLARISWGP